MIITFHSASKNSLTTPLLIVLMILIKSCVPISTPVNNINPNEKLGVVNVDGSEYSIKQNYKSEIKECISSDSEVKNRIINYDKDDLEGTGKLDFRSELITRKVIKRGNLSRGIPQRHIRSNPSYEIFLCVNRKGQVTLTRLIKSSQELTNQELNRLLSVAHDYEYEEKINSSCLECGKLTVKFEKP